MRAILLFLLLWPGVLNAQALQSFVETQLHRPVLQGALWGGMAIYTESPQTVLFATHENIRLTPASTLKLLTTAAALETFGPHHRFETNLYMQGTTDKNGVLHGALYVQGGADMTLGSARVTGSETSSQITKRWIGAIKRAGITQIDGNLIADISLFEGPTIAPKVNWENMGNYFAAPASPLCFNDNSFEIHFKSQSRANVATEVDFISPEIPQIHIENFVTTSGKSKKDNAYVYGAPGQYDLKIFGTIPTNKAGFSIKAALPNPALFTLQALKKELQAQGIVITGELQTTALAPDYTSFQRLDKHFSPELKDIVLIVNKRSFNLYADMLLRHLAIHAGQKGSLENGLTQLKKFLKDHHLASPHDMALYDGSGLARDNLLTPRVLVATLNYMAKSPYFLDYYNSLATPNDRGDLLPLRKYLKAHKRIEDVRLKGGTLDSVKAAAGYVKDKNGRLISFVFIANNLAKKDESLFRLHEAILKKLLN